MAQVYSQLGSDCPDVSIAQLKAAFATTQGLLRDGKILSGHDISDGGVAVALLEMAFSGVAGIDVDLPDPENVGQHATLFAEESGLLLEVAADDAERVCTAYSDAGVPCNVIGAATDAHNCRISVAGTRAIEGSCAALRDAWEATSSKLERLQVCAESPRTASSLSCMLALCHALRC